MYCVTYSLLLALLMSGDATVAATGDQADVCHLPPEPGMCRGYFPSFFFNFTAGQCQSFIYGGCQGNANRFGNQSACEQTCPGTLEEDICTLPAETGPCRASFRFYFHNATSGQCEQFIYGGCRGNANRFVNQSECELACLAKADTCSLPPEAGPCEGLFPSYFHNATSGQCEQFVYGGCDGNANRFTKITDCQQACPGSTNTDICTLPAETGPCRGNFESYFYNSTSEQCEQFIYGGCRGNDNRFTEKTGCLQACAGSAETDICTLPAVAGMCQAYIPSYFYNSTSRQCEQFIYGGCGGNGNRFSLRSDCEQTCFDTSGGSAFGFLSGFTWLSLVLVTSLMRVAILNN